MKIRSPKDFWSGLMFCAFGLLFVIVARNYRMGNATSMGPGYFPSMVGGLLVVLGGIVLVQSLVLKGEKVPTIFFRPLFFIIFGLLLFGYLLEVIGLMLAVSLLVVVAGFASHDLKLREALLLCLVLSVLSALVFVKGIGLDFPLWPGVLW